MPTVDKAKRRDKGTSGLICIDHTGSVTITLNLGKVLLGDHDVCTVQRYSGTACKSTLIARLVQVVDTTFHLPSEVDTA